MRPYLVIATINALENLRPLVGEFMRTGTKIVVVDEGDAGVRARNDSILVGLDRAYYGPRERLEWFKARFPSDYERHLSLIPERAHAETSFGFLVAYEEGAGYIVELDDDVFAETLMEEHRDNLLGEEGRTVSSTSRWYNTLDAIMINAPCRLFPRGHPYSPSTRTEEYNWSDKGGSCVLNMGHWVGNPDFDAMTILYHGGMDGRCGVRGFSLKEEKVVVGKGTYFAVCSMNTSFLPKVVPAFYQLYMNTMGIDRFDDIWSGIFLKRAADHLGGRVCLGKPAGNHDKRPRSVFKDLKKEIDGMIMNESVWEMVDADITGGSYSDAYLSVADLLSRGVKKFTDESQRRFMELQVEKMRLWVETVDSL
jgi:hypothetical protein